MTNLQRIPGMRNYANLTEVSDHLLSAGMSESEVNRILADLTQGSVSLRSAWVTETETPAVPESRPVEAT